MVERNKLRAFGIRGRREGERVKDDSQLSGLSSELLIVPLTERNTLLVFVFHFFICSDVYSKSMSALFTFVSKSCFPI